MAAYQKFNEDQWNKINEDELNLELQKGYADYTYGNIKSADKAFSRIHEDYGI